MKIRNGGEAFKSGDNDDYKIGRYKLQKSIKATKRAYTQRLENNGGAGRGPEGAAAPGTLIHKMLPYVATAV